MFTLTAYAQKKYRSYLAPLASIEAFLVMALLPVPMLLRVVALVLHIALFSWFFGRSIARHASPTLTMHLGALLWASIHVIVGTVLFYFGYFTYFNQIFVALMIPLLLLATPRPSPASHSIYESALIPRLLVSINISLLCMLLLGIIIAQSTTLSAITPWALTPSIIFPLFFACVALLLFTTLRSTTPFWLVSIPLFVVSLSVAPIIFPLGYGFDPFIHEATMRLLDATSSITPMPLAYVGYYSLLLFLHRAISVPIAVLNAWIVPILASLLIPGLTYSVFRYVVLEKRYAILASFALLVFPYPLLVQSTPQSLSFIFLIATSLLVFASHVTTIIPRWIAWIVATAAFAMHPLTGIPALLLCSLSVLSEYRGVRKMTLAITVLIGSVALPLAFIVAGRISPELQTRLTSPVLTMSPVLGLLLFRFTTLDDLTYTFSNYAQLLLLLVTVSGAYLLYRRRHAIVVPFVLTTAAILCSGFLIRYVISFNFITAAEQMAFSDRIITAALYSAYPLAALAFVTLLRKANGTSVMHMLVLSIAIATAATASWYLSYPRFDTRYQHTGHTVSRTDAQAVRLIEQDARGEPYIVLANQTLSAAALRELGFAHYYGGFFFYPIPTSNALYRQFERAATLPTAGEDAIREARRLTDVRRVYLVLHDYWRDYQELTERYRSNASKSFSLGSGAISVFVYE